MPSRYLIATRKSALALWQAHTTQTLLQSQGILADIYPVVTTGDKLQHVALADVVTSTTNLPHHLTTGKGLFIKEVQEALLSNAAHIAVHSMKDLPVEQTQGLELVALLPRADPRDVLILSPQVLQEINLSTPLCELSFAQLKEALLKSPTFLEKTIGTTSARRQLLVKKHFSKSLHLNVLRGNVDSRLKRVLNNEFSAILLAKAGLDRLGLFDPQCMVALPETLFVPASAQGVVGIEVSQNHALLTQALLKISCKTTCIQTAIERMVLCFLEGDCNSAVGVHYAGDKIYVLYGRGAKEKEMIIPVTHSENLEVSEIFAQCEFVYAQLFEKIFNTSLAKKCLTEASKCLA